MKFAGHNNADTFFGSYAPELSTVDGMASYWNKKRRTVHLEGFRGLSSPAAAIASRESGSGP